MKTTVITAVTVLILVMMSGMAAADQEMWPYGMMGSECPDCTDAGYDTASLPREQLDVSSAVAEVLETGGIPVTGIEEDWLHERRNTIPEGLECAYWDFEEGYNLQPFRNQHPSVAAFMNVLSIPYGTDGVNEPSYVTSCAHAMHIYPCWYWRNTDGTPVDFIYIVNGNDAYAPRTMSTMGWMPGSDSYIVFKDDTHYVSFLASVGATMKVRMYDTKGNVIHRATIYSNYDRVEGIGNNPSNFTRFSVYIPDKPIAAMKLLGPYNGHLIDDLIVGGEPGYLPEEPVNYTYVARRAQELWGVDYLEYGLGHDYVMMDYMDPWQFIDGMMGEYWNPETKTFEEGEGISNAGLILWAYNYDSDALAGTSFVKRNTVAGMEKSDFKVDVDSAFTQPGDVCFMDRRDRKGELGSDGYADEVYMVIEKTSNGMDLIYSNPNEGIGVQYSKKSIVESSPAFMGYKRLPGVIRGGKDPIPKGH